MIEPLFLLMRWIQTIPMVLLMATPFDERELRLRREFAGLFSVIYMLLASVLLAVASVAASTNGTRNIIARDLGMAAMMAVYFWGWANMVRTPAVRKVTVAVIMLHYAAILNALSNILASLILEERYLGEINADAGSLTFNLCLLASTAITWPVVWYFLRHVLRKNLPVLDDRQIRRGLGYMCIVFFMFCVATYNPPYEMRLEMLIVVMTLVVTDMVAYYIFFQEIGAVHRKEEAIRQLESYRLQYQQISARVEEARRLRHDMRHHLITLGALNAQGKQAEITDYLKRYGGVYDQLEGCKDWKDPVVESILGYYLAKADEEGIPINCNVILEGSTGIDPVDMTVLLSNCLENSMEALRHIPQEKRQLDIDIQITGKILLLQIINSCMDVNGTKEFTTWEHFSSGKSRGRKGVGLQSIAGSAEKYGGSARFQQKDGMFTVRVVLNLP